MCIMNQKISVLAKKSKTPRLQGSVNVASAMEIMDMYEVDILGVECEEIFAGVFSRGDYSRNVIRQNLLPHETTLYEVMRLNPPYVMADLSVKETYDAMLAYQWEYMPVLSGRSLCGIVSMRELSKDLMKSYETAKSENSVMLRYLQAGESYAISDS